MTDRYPDRAVKRGKARKLERQQQAAERNAAADPQRYLCGHIHGNPEQAHTCPQYKASLETAVVQLSESLRRRQGRRVYTGKRA